MAGLAEKEVQLVALMKRIKGLYLAHSKLDAARLEELIKKELHLDASIALEYGLVDRIVPVAARA